jgi:hypothetical protein
MWGRGGADAGFRLGEQLSDCNSLSGLNSLTNWVLNIYSYLMRPSNNILFNIKNKNKIKLKVINNQVDDENFLLRNFIF